MNETANTNQSTNEAQLKRFIYKLHYRTFDKIWPHVHQHYPNVSEEHVRSIIRGFVKDPPKLRVKQYFNKIYADHPHAWMCDLLDNAGKTDDYKNKDTIEAKEKTKLYPRYWFIFIGINTRYVVAYPLFDKNKQQVNQILNHFLSNFKCTSLTSDKESAFIANENVDLLRRHHVSQFIVIDNNHTSLALIDAFIRHLRDRNTPTEKSKYQSYHSKYRNFSFKRMKQLVDTYNNTIHNATGYKPIDMLNDVKLERQYIANCLIRKMRAKPHDIPVGHYVRIVITKNIMKKKRFKVSRECYVIKRRDGFNYLVSAADDTTMSLPRHRLIDLGDKKPDKYKLANTFVNGDDLANYANKHYPQLPNFK